MVWIKDCQKARADLSFVIDWHSAQNGLWKRRGPALPISIHTQGLQLPGEGGNVDEIMMKITKVSFVMRSESGHDFKWFLVKKNRPLPNRGLSPTLDLLHS